MGTFGKGSGGTKKRQIPWFEGIFEKGSDLGKKTKSSEKVDFSGRRPRAARGHFLRTRKQGSEKCLKNR